MSAGPVCTPRVQCFLSVQPLIPLSVNSTKSLHLCNHACDKFLAAELAEIIELCLLWSNTRLEIRYTKQTINIVHKQSLWQTHTTVLHSRFTNCPPNTRVLTSHGSWIEIANKIQAFFSAAGGCSEMSICFPLATKLPEMHPFLIFNTD